MLALVFMYVGFKYFDANIGGLFSPEYLDAPWSMAKVWDMVKHLPLPALILGLGGTAQMIRIMRANLLDELQNLYHLSISRDYPVRQELGFQLALQFHVFFDKMAALDFKKRHGGEVHEDHKLVQIGLAEGAQRVVVVAGHKYPAARLPWQTEGHKNKR